MPVVEIQDRELLRAFLVKDRVGRAYQLGYLDEAYAPWCRWWGVVDAETEALRLLLLLYTGLSVPAAITVGEAAAVPELLESIYTELPDRFFAHLRPEHIELFSGRYDTQDLQPCLRMALERERYQPQELDPFVIRLGHRDTAEIVKLYDHYPDNLFEPYQLESGLYFGIHRRSGGQLISIAGIHVVSHANDVAVVGNVVTHPKYRRNALAARVLARLLSELFDLVSLVAVNIPEGNEPALRLMERTQFGVDHTFHQGLVRRRY
jgi:GNAT superfamily N-acetyltransferase